MAINFNSKPKSTPLVGTVQGSQDGIDLDVSHIEFLPKYNRYRVEYPTDLPTLVPIPGDADANPTNDKHFPDQNETVHFTAFITNHGKVASPTFNFKWTVDNQELCSRKCAGLAAGQQTSSTLDWQWDNITNHKVTFSVDSANKITEISETNNSVTEYTKALSLSIFVEQGWYDAISNLENATGSYSFEDWLRWQLKEYHRRFLEAKYAQTPNGISEQVRVDRIVIVPNREDNLNQWRQELATDPYLYQTDGRWQFVADFNTLAQKQALYSDYSSRFIKNYDSGLFHELTHQLGIIDDYRFLKPNDPANHNRIFVKDKAGNFVDPLNELNCQGLMGGDSASSLSGSCLRDVIEDQAAYPLNLHQGLRRGFYGEYLYDVPKNNYLRILSAGNLPLEGASVALYQKAEDSEIIDDQPEHEGITNSAGVIFLANTPAPAVTTVTGHTLQPNPFGKIKVTGENGSFLVKIRYKDQEEFHWLNLRPFNLAFWEGKKDSATYDLVTKLQP